MNRRMVIDRLTIRGAASAPESMALILIGVAFSVPAIIGYTVFAYSVFGGKARRMDYG